MADQFIDTVVSNAPSQAGSRGPVISEVMGEGSTSAHVVEGTGATVESIEIQGASGRALTEGTRAKIAALMEAKRAERAESNEADGDGETDDDPDAPPGEVAPEVKADAADAAKAKPAEGDSDPIAALKADIARRDEANKKLYEDLEAERKKPREAPAAPRVKLLGEAADAYIEDSITSVRKLIAAGLGIDDPASPEVDVELAGLYTDLTAKELGVTPDPAHQAKRDAARARQLWAREKRERKAEGQDVAEKAKADAEAEKATNAATFIGNRLQTKASDYPLLHELAEDLDGLKPSALLWRVIQRETKTGRLDPSLPDDKLIDAAASLVENHYQALAAKATKASTRIQTSTAKPNDDKSSAAATSASKEQRQSHGARNLTAADASVAPATPPAKKPATKKDERPTFKNDDERKKWALRHLRAPKS